MKRISSRAVIMSRINQGSFAVVANIRITWPAGKRYGTLSLSSPQRSVMCVDESEISAPLGCKTQMGQEICPVWQSRQYLPPLKFLHSTQVVVATMLHKVAARVR